MRSLSLVALVLAAILEAPPPAHACTLVPIEDHALDAAHSSDTVAPSAVMASAIVQRQSTDGGCAGAQSRCGGGAWITLAVSATDNAATADKLGYQLRIVDGDAPRGLDIPETPVQPVGGQLYFHFDADYTAGFEIDIELRARDLNGNLGPPTIVVVGEPGESGCATSRPATFGSVLLALIALLARRRRR